MTDTDKPATPEFDMAASVARFFAERDERNRRAEAVRPDNKTALFDALKIPMRRMCMTEHQELLVT